MNVGDYIITFLIILNAAALAMYVHASLREHYTCLQPQTSPSSPQDGCDEVTFMISVRGGVGYNTGPSKRWLCVDMSESSHQLYFSSSMSNVAHFRVFKRQGSAWTRVSSISTDKTNEIANNMQKFVLQPCKLSSYVRAIDGGYKFFADEMDAGQAAEFSFPNKHSGDQRCSVSHGAATCDIFLSWNGLNLYDSNGRTENKNWLSVRGQGTERKHMFIQMSQT